MLEYTDESYIGLICNGEFDSIKDFKIGELFESFFDNINYNVVKEKENIYVDFTGEAMCDDEPCTILIRFKIDSNGEEFEINLVKVNDDILGEEEVLDLLDDIAFAGGAILDDEDYYGCAVEGGCEHCMHPCGAELEEDEDSDAEEDDYNYEEDDDDDNNE